MTNNNYSFQRYNPETKEWEKIAEVKPITSIGYLSNLVIEDDGSYKAFLESIKDVVPICINIDYRYNARRKHHQAKSYGSKSKSLSRIKRHWHPHKD